MSEATLVHELQRVLTGKALTDVSSLNAVSTDFGRLSTRIPRVVVKPASADDVAAAIQVATRYHVPVTARGTAHTQSGQALNEGGVVIDLTTLNQHFEVNEEEKSVTVHAGMLWKNVVDGLKDHKHLPMVLTSNLGVTVGGSLSIAGLGGSSFKYGTQADNCLELEVVTGAGEIVQCSPKNNPELYTHALCGLGQYGVITKVKMKIRPHKTHVRTFFLLYDTLKSLLRDSRHLMDEGRMDYVEAWSTPLPMGFRRVQGVRQTFAEWFFPMHVSYEFDHGSPAPDENKILQGLTAFRYSHNEDLEIHEYINRMENVYDMWKRSGFWGETHPWMQTLMPWDMAERYINQVLANLPPALLGGGLVTLCPFNSRTTMMPLFKRPDTSHIMSFGVFSGVPREVMESAVQRFNTISELSESMGGKRYLSGLVQFDKQKWKDHFGDTWSDVKRMKKKFDPNGILNPGFIDYSA